jgi:hypothetical protein
MKKHYYLSNKIIAKKQGPSPYGRVTTSKRYNFYFVAPICKPLSVRFDSRLRPAASRSCLSTTGMHVCIIKRIELSHAGNFNLSHNRQHSVKPVSLRLIQHPIHTVKDGIQCRWSREKRALTEYSHTLTILAKNTTIYGSVEKTMPKQRY